MTNNPLVSVILATKNEEENIERCIESLQNQSYPHIEIIVVDNNSTDTTRTLAEKYSVKTYNIAKEIPLVNIKNYRGAQVNFGVNNSKGDIIFFPDTDMTFDTDLINEAVDLLDVNDALYIPEIVIGKGFFGKIRNFERSFYNQTCIDAIRIVKKSSYINSEGFDVHNIVFGPDDWDFTKTLKKMLARFGVTESRLYHHEEWMTLQVYLKKKMHYTNTFDGYIAKWGRNDNDIKRQFGLWYRYFGVFSENGKVLRLLASPVLTMGMYLMRIAVGGVFVLKKLISWK